MATASHGYYAAAIAARLGIADVVATNAKRDAQGRVLSILEGDNCYGAVKLRMILDWLSREGIKREDAHVRAYSDHVSDAPMADIVDLILKVRAGAYSIEAANARHEHEWRVWQDVDLPPGRILIPGVVTHHTTTVEHPRLVADRIVRFAGLVGRENVIAGTDCGFAQVEAFQRVHPQVMWAKLESLAEGARLASEELFS